MLTLTTSRKTTRTFQNTSEIQRNTELHRFARISMLDTDYSFFALVLKSVCVTVKVNERSTLILPTHPPLVKPFQIEFIQILMKIHDGSNFLTVVRFYLVNCSQFSCRSCCRLILGTKAEKTRLITLQWRLICLIQ